MVTVAANTGFGMPFGFAYSFGHPYGRPHGFQGFIPPPELSQGFPTGHFGPYRIYGPNPWLLSRSLRNTMALIPMRLNLPCPWETLAILYHLLLWLLTLFKRTPLIYIMTRASTQTLSRMQYKVKLKLLARNRMLSKGRIFLARTHARCASFQM